MEKEQKGEGSREKENFVHPYPQFNRCPLAIHLADHIGNPESGIKDAGAVNPGPLLKTITLQVNKILESITVDPVGSRKKQTTSWGEYDRNGFKLSHIEKKNGPNDGGERELCSLWAEETLDRKWTHEHRGKFLEKP